MISSEITESFHDVIVNSLKVCSDKRSQNLTAQETKFSIVTISSKSHKILKDFLRKYRKNDVFHSTVVRRFLFGIQKNKIVFGLLVYEYLSYSEQGSPFVLTAYISKLDTTGLMEPREFQHGLISLLLDSYCETLKYRARLLMVSDLLIFVQAKSNPSYLFPNSEKLPKKGQIIGRKLVYWWKDELENLNDGRSKKFWIIPGYDESLIPRDHRSDQWTWGFAVNSDELASEAIPRFQDDIKSTCLERTLGSNSVSVKCLINDILPVMADAKDCNLGLLCIEFNVNHDKEAESDFLDFEGKIFNSLTKFLNLVPDVSAEDVWNFESIERTEKNTGQLLEIISKSKHKTLSEDICVLIGESQVQGMNKSNLELSNLFNVKDKVVLVTGGSRGIGKMIAEGFSVNGAKVYITARKEAECRKTADDIKCKAIPADISTSAGIQFLISKVNQLEGKLDVLVNNAGCTWAADIENHSDSNFEKVIQLNLKTVFSMIRESLPLLRASSLPSRIINIGSINGVNPPSSFETFGYSASKAGLHMLTRHLASTLAPQITVNAVAPGSFESKMMAETLRNMNDIIIAGCPMRRIGLPEDMASVCLWLAGPGGTYVNGAVVIVDGGTSIQDSGKTLMSKF